MDTNIPHLSKQAFWDTNMATIDYCKHARSTSSPANAIDHTPLINIERSIWLTAIKAEG